MFNSKKKKAAKAAAERKQLVQTALVAGSVTSLCFAVGKTVEHFAASKVRSAQADLRMELAKAIAVNSESINLLQEEASASREAVEALTRGLGTLTDAVKVNAEGIEGVETAFGIGKDKLFKELGILHEAAVIAAERRKGLSDDIERLEAKIEALKPNGLKPNGLKPNGVKPNGVNL